MAIAVESLESLRKSERARNWSGHKVRGPLHVTDLAASDVQSPPRPIHALIPVLARKIDYKLEAFKSSPTSRRYDEKW